MLRSIPAGALVAGEARSQLLGDAPFDLATTVYSVPNFYGAR